MTGIEEHLARSLTPYQSASHWLVAYSGGVDSHVLLHALVQWHKQAGRPLPPLRALHINHQMQPDANDWQRHCEAVCEALQVPLQVVTVTVENHGEGWEAAARRARYQAFREAIGENDLLLMAHHADDQIETLLMRLLRGSGLRGLAAMPGTRPLGRGHLLRPLLTLSRAELESYASVQGLQWVEDPSNNNHHYDRNFLRHRVLPVLSERWPDFRQPLLRSAGLAAQSERLLRQLAASDLHQLGVGLDQPLPVSRLLSLGEDRRDNLLRFWLLAWGVSPPTTVQFQQLIQDVLLAREGASPIFHLGDRQLRRYRGGLYVTALSSATPSGCHAWRPDQGLSIPQAGELHAKPVTGSGLRMDGEFQVHFRQGGERCRPAGRRHSQTLKKLLQEWGLEPWWRDRVPLIYSGDQLAAVADLWICDGWAAGSGEQGWQLCWRRPGKVQPEFVLE